MTDTSVDRSYQPPMLLSDSAAKDVMITWFRGEFAAANAIIDALCGHPIQTSPAGYDGVMAALHCRRLNWIPLLHMQKYHSISQVTLELQTATAYRLDKRIAQTGAIDDDDSPSSDITDSGSRDETSTVCWKHEEECESRASLVKQSKRFSAKEHVRGHTMNVVKGLKLYQDVFTATQLSKLLDFVNELREAGRNNQLSGETFVMFNKNMKGTKRELIQLGVPIFGNTKDEHSVEPIPNFVKRVIDHLLQCRVIPEYKRPNGCVINFFDEEEHSQPFQKPPHVDQPISTLVLSESTMVFGHKLRVDDNGNFKGSLTLPLREGSLLVIRGNSADMARHVMCSSPNKRVAITFFKLKPNKVHPPRTKNPVTLWQTCTPTPLVVLAQALKRLDTGTGVFLPWTPPVSRKPTKHLPPRVRRLCFLSSVADRESTLPEI